MDYIDVFRRLHQAVSAADPSLTSEAPILLLPRPDLAHRLLEQLFTETGPLVFQPRSAVKTIDDGGVPYRQLEIFGIKVRWPRAGETA